MNNKMSKKKIFESLKLPRTSIVKREIEILNLCRGKRVLHLGCVDYPLTSERVSREELLHMKIMEVAKAVIGVDISQEGIEYLRDKCGINNIVYGDVEDLLTLDIASDFDVVIGGELLEHLSNPGLFLKQLQAFCKTDTTVILTVPNAFSAKSFLRMMTGRELVHPDHVAYYSVRTLSQLVGRFGFEVSSTRLYLIPSRSIFKRILQIFLHIVIKYFTPYLADGLIVQLHLKRGA